MRKLYDLCTADADVRLSPPCWLVKFALKHKGLDFETVPLRFTDKDRHPDPDYGLFPVLEEEDGSLVRDSAAIIAYLEEAYPDNPLWRTDGERAASAVIQGVVGGHVFPPLIRPMFLRVHNTLAPADQAYFRETREARIGMTLEDFAADQTSGPKIEAALKTLSAPLEAHAFFGGAAPNISDYIVAAPLMWQRTTTSDALYETPAPLAVWFERILDLYDGFGRSAPRAA
ncbi:MAG: glutathione S-transferase N-terminal domain-containing protein [Pseudomonadota bacterium]